MLTKLFRRTGTQVPSEECLYVEHRKALDQDAMSALTWLMSGGGFCVTHASKLDDEVCVEFGPRRSIETPFSSNAVAICCSMGIPVQRVEMSRRVPHAERSLDEILAAYGFDYMTQEVYEHPICTFDSGVLPEPVRIIPLLEQGEAALVEINAELGLGMDAWDIKHYLDLFLNLGRNPTDVELFQIGNGNSEHSRHLFFRGRLIIDGVEMPSLMDIVKEPWRQHPNNTLVAFRDNAGVIEGGWVEVLIPEMPGSRSAFSVHRRLMRITFTGETHNHPTFVSPFQGATTGSGGRIRDTMAVVRGATNRSAGTAGYCVGNLHIPGYIIPGEQVDGERSRRYASPLAILIEGSNGVSDYGNKIGEPLIGGFCRSFDQNISDGTRHGFVKPVLFSGGLGRILDNSTEKHPPEAGMLIVAIGGPAYRIGVGGGAASSMEGGIQGTDLDLKSVQRGDAEMENRVNRVISACVEMGDFNPIESIHDQGAGGPSNVLIELMDPAGGVVDIRKIVVGDPTMSVLELWVAEYQERYTLLITHANLEVFRVICGRESVNCEVLGTITGNEKVVVWDSKDSTTPVNLPLKNIIGSLPQKSFYLTRVPCVRTPLVFPEGLTVADALEAVFKLPSVGSKGFLVRKVDRSVTGLVARQQCCGPMHVPVADAGVTADSFFGLSGAATSIGEQPIKMLVDPAAGARMAVAEMLTNIAGVRITALSDIKCHANWMWAAKLEGEGARLYDAAVAMRDIMLVLEIAITGGKDSLSMSARVGDETVKSPGQLVISGYAPVPDITKVVTPDLKGDGFIGLIDLGWGRDRMGGSALAQAFGQIGDESLDIDDPRILKRAFEAVQELVAEGLITSYHDRSDGGLITTIAEMCMAGNRGAHIYLPDSADVIRVLFNEEAGMVFECPRACWARVAEVCVRHGVIVQRIGSTIDDASHLYIAAYDGTMVMYHHVTKLREWWESTSDRLEMKQSNPLTVQAEVESYADTRKPIPYHLAYPPKDPRIVASLCRPKIAIVREEGINGDREMAAAAYIAGFDPVDVTMSDLKSENVSSLDSFRGVIFPGGFSYADVFGSAKGWAGAILFNSRVRKKFDDFYERSDTFSLGVCNGFQLMTLLGWLPGRHIAETAQPRLVHNTSGRFESRWTGVKILPSPSIFFRGMEGSVLGAWSAHGEGKLLCPDPQVLEDIRTQQLVPLAYVDPDGNQTSAYPYNPNGSPEGWTALCSPDGHHTGMMPHGIDRGFLKWQWPYWPPQWKEIEISPWLHMFVNARDWCLER